MKKFLIILIFILLVLALVLPGCGKYNPLTTDPSMSEIVTATPTATMVPYLIDDFENDTAGSAPVTNELGGSWGTWAAGDLAKNQYCSVTITVVTGAGGSGAKALRVRANIIGQSFPGVSCTTSMNASWTPADLNVLTTNGYTGLGFKIKKVDVCSPATDYLIQMGDSRISDGSYWLYHLNPVLIQNEWTTIKVPFSYFNLSAWGGTGDSFTREDVYQNVNAFIFSLEMNDGTYSCTGTEIYIDDIEIY